jgi:ATP-dependent exoDNAse (exonuclease V) alpha subunit
MAIYHLSASMIGRSSGRSATASAAYRAACVVRDERTGEVHDYGRKTGVEATLILAPEGAPDWAHDRMALWNAVEAVETRKDAQVAREITVALPAELDAADRRALVEGWVADQLVSQGMVADIAFHTPHREGDQRNHHAHILLTTRVLGPEGFGPKERGWNGKDQLATWRESWAEAQNRALERAHVSERVDHRGLAAQGLEDLPTRHLGPAATALERQEAREAAKMGREVEPITEAGRWNAFTRECNAALGWARERAQEARDLWDGLTRQVNGLADQLTAVLGSGLEREIAVEARERWERSFEGRMARLREERKQERAREGEREGPRPRTPGTRGWSR